MRRIATYAGDRILENRHVARIAADEGLRAGTAAACSVLFDLAYEAFTMVVGFAYDSGWAVAVALYHVAIVLMAFASRKLRAADSGA